VAVHRCTQVHGARVLVVGEVPPGLAVARWAPGPAGTPPVGDALVSRRVSECLAVLTADCAALALASPEGVHGAVHVGWRGLLAGVVQASVAALRALGAAEVVTAVGPCIHPCCYEFGETELALLVARYVSAVRAVTNAGTPALDLLAGLDVALAEVGVTRLDQHGGCTVCGPDAFSFRRAGDEARQALFVWRPGAL
jgi:copper oxidase (laccase) domain-containing protein